MEPETSSKSPEEHSLSTSSNQNLAPNRKTIDDIQQLTKNIQASCEKNRAHYNRIIKQNPSFIHSLYNPPILLSTKRSQINITKHLLIRQLDNLLEEENKFLRQLNKLQIREEEDRFSKECHLEKETNYYLFLRNVWKRNIAVIDSQDRIEKLNKSVALIKGQIMTMSKREAKQIAISPGGLLTRDFILNSSEYLQLRKEYQNLLQEVQEQTQKSNKGKLRSRKSINSNSEEMAKLEQENSQLRVQIHDYKQKLKTIEKESLASKIRIQELEEQLYAKDREVHKLTKDLRIVYKAESQQYQIQIFSKNLTGKEEKKLERPLQHVIEAIEGNSIQTDELDLKIQFGTPAKNMNGLALSARGTISGQRVLQISSAKKQTEQKQSEERKRFNHIQLDGLNTHSRRLNSISDNNVQTEVKKTRFIRTLTRNNLDEGKSKNQEMNTEKSQPTEDLTISPL